MIATPPRLWLVRHARPLLQSGICYGALDVPADPAATAQAAHALASALPAGVRVYSSPLQRCELLANSLQALRPDLASKPDARLREMHFGAWEGQAWSAIGKGPVDAWIAAFATHPPGGGECLAAMLVRVAAALRAAQEAPATDVVWITHAGVARCVAWLQLHGEKTAPRAEDWPVAAPGWGEWEIRALA